MLMMGAMVVMGGRMMMGGVAVVMVGRVCGTVN